MSIVYINWVAEGVVMGELSTLSWFENVEKNKDEIVYYLFWW